MAKRSGHAGRIVALRKALKITQSALAKNLRVGQPVVAGWEGGKEKYGPSPEMFLRLGNLASKKGRYEDALWFFEKAGVERKSLLFAANERRKEQTIPADATEVAPISPSQKVPEQASLPILRLPARWIPNVETTRYVLLSDEFGSPLFEAGGTLVIDESETDWRKLQGSCVALYIPPRKETEPTSEAKKVVVSTLLLPGKEVRLARQNGVSAAWLLRGEIQATDAGGAGAPLYALKPGRNRIFETAVWGARFSDNGIVEDPIFETSLLGLEDEERKEKPIILGRVIAWIPQTGTATPEV